MGDNAVLRRHMDDLGLTQAELARVVNTAIEDLTGKPGTVSERTVYNWLTGATRWPPGRIRAALKAVFGCSGPDLGFVPPAKARPTRSEMPVQRRAFLATSTGAAASLAVPFINTRHTVGHSDVDRLRASLETLIALDDQRGGHDTLESDALMGAQQALALQQVSASQAVRMRLYSLAADFTATAAWSAIDSRQLDRASRHLDRTLTLASLGRDGATQLRALNFQAMIGYQRRRWADAVAAAQAAQAIGVTKRDPLLASLAHARTAIGHAAIGDRHAALRSLGHAQDALHRAESRPRPAWTSFYDGAELAALAAVVHHHLGEPEQSEGASHRALGGIPPQFRRNRASATARLALAQLGQKDIEEAYATATSVYALMDGDPLPPRIRTLLSDFHRGLLTLAPDSTITQEWTDRVRTQGARQ